MAELIYENNHKGKDTSHSFSIKLDNLNVDLYVYGQGATKKEALEDFKMSLVKTINELNAELKSIDWDILAEGDDKPTEDYWGRY